MNRATALSLTALLLVPTQAEARLRCHIGLVYRPSLGACSHHRFHQRVRVLYRTRIVYRTRIIHDKPKAPSWAGSLGAIKREDFK